MRMNTSKVEHVWVEKGMCTKKKNLHMASMYHFTFVLIYIQSNFNTYMFT
jgi:hypothetical protein